MSIESVTQHEVDFTRVHNLSIQILETLKSDASVVTPTAVAALALTLVRVASDRTFPIEEEIHYVQSLMTMVLSLIQPPERIHSTLR